jgi:hypothetical protein
MAQNGVREDDGEYVGGRVKERDERMRARCGWQPTVRVVTLKRVSGYNAAHGLPTLLTLAARPMAFSFLFSFITLAKKSLFLQSTVSPSGAASDISSQTKIKLLKGAVDRQPQRARR